MSDLKQTLPSSTRALPFTCDPTTIETITTAADVVFSLDSTDAADGTTVSLAILQNHSVDFPVDFIELSGSRQPVLGKMNYYILARLNGDYQFVRYQSTDDGVENAGVIGRTQFTVSETTETTVALSWTTATGATEYVVKRYTTADYSDAPVTVYTGSNLAVTDTGLIADTHYYYKINPATASITGRAAFADGMTGVTMSTILFDHIFENIDDFEGGVGIESYEGTNRAHFYPSCNQNPYSIYSNVAATQIVAGDNFRLTLTGVVFGNSNQNGDVTFGGVHFDINPAAIVNETLVLRGTAVQTSGQLVLGYNPYRCDSDFYLRKMKIEKMLLPTVPDLIDNNYVAANKLQGTVVGTAQFAGDPAWLISHADDLNKETYYISQIQDTDWVSNSTAVYWGLDLGTAKVVKTIAYIRRGGETLWNSFVFQGSNTSFTENMEDLFSITYPDNDTVTSDWIVKRLTNTTAYKYYRFRNYPGIQLISFGELAMFEN